MMEKTRQILVLAANQPGTLANICGTLADEKINIRGISVVDHVDHALIRMVVDEFTKALHLLGEAGLPVLEDEVLLLSMSEGPGALEKVAAVLGRADLNIHYAYASEPLEGGSTSLVLKTSDDDRALSVLKKELKA